MAVRLALLTNHYRTSWAWDAALLDVATRRLSAWRLPPRTGAGAWSSGAGGALGAVRAALDDDLDTPAAVAAIDEAVSAGEGVAEAAGLLGVVLDGTGG
jgi:L-cysteine:1D-myo-inositol 2-amino-2-deoxy-alpha-D-glucopyranoside ligase